MKRHKVLEHTADVRLWVEADTLEELFRAALEGMAGLIKEDIGDGKKLESIVEIDSPDKTSLLIDFLSEILTLSHSENAVYNEVKFEVLTETNVFAKVSGFYTNGFDDDIKAVTYHEAEIKQKSDGTFETMIVFDI